MHSDSLKAVEGITAEICKEKEELIKKHQEDLTVIETLRAENVSLCLTLWIVIIELFLIVFKEKHKDVLENARKNSRSAMENLERALVK